MNLPTLHVVGVERYRGVVAQGPIINMRVLVIDGHPDVAVELWHSGALPALFRDRSAHLLPRHDVVIDADIFAAISHGACRYVAIAIIGHFDIDARRAVSTHEASVAERVVVHEGRV